MQGSAEALANSLMALKAEDDRCEVTINQSFIQYHHPPKPLSIQYNNPPKPPSSPKAFIGCGTDPSSARSLGCVSMCLQVVVKVLQSGVGDVTQSDVALASVSRAKIIGFNVAADMPVRGRQMLYSPELLAWRVGASSQPAICDSQQRSPCDMPPVTTTCR